MKPNEKRKKQKPLSWYKKKLWDVFKRWVKANENYTCFTCGERCEGKNCHAGHFVKASICGLELYFSEDNVHVQCARCNLWLDGNQYEYGIRLGVECVEKLRAIQKETKGKIWDRATYDSKIHYYEERIAKLL